jgi:hypothetical protein
LLRALESLGKINDDTESGPYRRAPGVSVINKPIAGTMYRKIDSAIIVIAQKYRTTSNMTIASLRLAALNFKAAKPPATMIGRYISWITINAVS